MGELKSLLKNLDISKNKYIIFAGDFNIFFNSKLEAKSHKLLLKRKYIAKFVKIKESLDICDIWRILILKILHLGKTIPLDLLNVN